MWTGGNLEPVRAMWAEDHREEAGDLPSFGWETECIQSAQKGDTGLSLCDDLERRKTLRPEESRALKLWCCRKEICMKLAALPGLRSKSEWVRSGLIPAHLTRGKL